MFGYVVPNKAELKFREFDTYRSYYCGLCSALRKNYGYTGALSLTYDMTFLSMLLNSLYEPKCAACHTRCVCHPFKKHCEMTDKYSPYVADMSILLSYYKCIDDWHDNKSIPKLLYAALLLPGKKKASLKYPRKAAEIKRLLGEISQNESGGTLEENASAFGSICGVIFTPEEDIWHKALYSIGFYLGKFIYILDAYDDIEGDIKHNRPNPLKNLHSAPSFDEECENLLNMMAAECAAEFEKLPLIENAEILRNILYAGIWTRFCEIAKTKSAEK